MNKTIYNLYSQLYL